MDPPPLPPQKFKGKKAEL